GGCAAHAGYRAVHRTKSRAREAGELQLQIYRYSQREARPAARGRAPDARRAASRRLLFRAGAPSPLKLSGENGFRKSVQCKPPDAELFRSNAEQALVAANEDLALTDRQRSKTFFAKLVLCDELELGSGFDDASHSFIVEKINQTIGRNQRGMVFAHPFLP